jgi:hypothetical protein
VEGVWWVEVQGSGSVTNGIKDTAMQLPQAARELQVRLNTSADVRRHWEVHTVGLVLNSTGFDKVINFHVDARALEHMVGKETM